MPPQWLTYLPLCGLCFARCAGMLCLSPPLAWRHFPLVLRLAVAAAVSVPLALSLPALSTQIVPAWLYVTWLAQELAVGLLLGLGLWLLLTAAAAAGRLVETSILPESDEEGPLTTLLGLLVILLFVQLNGLEWLVSYLRDSYHLLAPGGRLLVLDDFRACLYWPGRMFVNLLVLAAPLFLATTLASLLVASLQRCVAGVQVGQLGAAARYLAAILALVVTVPLLGGFVLGQMSAVAAMAATALGTLSHN